MWLIFCFFFVHTLQPKFTPTPCTPILRRSTTSYAMVFRPHCTHRGHEIGLVREASMRDLMRKNGFIEAGKEGHHWAIPQNQWGKDISDWIKNQPWNIKSLDSVTHGRLRHKVGDLRGSTLPSVCGTARLLGPKPPLARSAATLPQAPKPSWIAPDDRSTPSFQFPVLALGSNRKWIDFLLAPHDFSVCESWKMDFRDGMSLADSNGRCWTIISVQNLGATGGFWERILRSVLRCPIYRVSCELSEPALYRWTTSGTASVRPWTPIRTRGERSTCQRRVGTILGCGGASNMKRSKPG